MRKILFVGVALLVAAGAFAMGGADKGSAPAVPAVTQAGADKMYVQYLLPYAYDALEPSIDTATMVLHYSKHHAGYTNNLNNAVDKAGITGLSIEELLSSLDTIGDAALRAAIRNNGGGFTTTTSILRPCPPMEAALPLEPWRRKSTPSLVATMNSRLP